MGALRRAQQALSRTQNSDSEDSNNEEESSEESEEEPEDTPPTQEWSLKARPDISKRQNKHAPTEVSSKKPVTRRRTIVQSQTPQVRDPRFLPMTGEFSSEKFRKNYGFLADSHKTELQTLRENLKRAKKSLSSSPRDLRPEREAEIKRLELAVKRAESTVNKDRREEIEQQALEHVSKEERDKRKTGKGSWYLKDSAKKEILMKARYDAIAQNGGQSAVKKAIEKRRKKVSQKEKKSRPFAKDDARSGKRPLDTSGGPSEKRRKLW
ncbi:rRNA biogenesis protein rrp36 [Stygiomarasmius scandens]|uniref:rRNA biogenesis protein RRP36 n=1 Tax=Marasmiellus scandens TaxID=2682957 RepID=A0ABR1JYD6_9AGAR